MLDELLSNSSHT